MANRSLKAFFTLCSVVLTLAFVVSCIFVPVSAASNGIYIATATPHYRHPTLGTIEDSGGEGSAVLGQSMTDSATYKQALVEVDPSGNTFVTIRLQLMDNIRDPQFQVDSSRNGSFSSVSSDLMQEDNSNNTADYRMQVPSENAIIRCNMYVTAMGREVIFYITVSDLQAGSGDFIASVTVEEQQAKEPAKQEPVDAKVSQKEPEPEDTVSEASSASISAVTSTASEVENSTSSSSKTTSKSSTSVAGLEEFDASGQMVNKTESLSQNSSGSSVAIWWVIGIIVVLAAAGGCVWYFCFFKKKKD